MTAPPYPADTRAKGWRFEIDHERIRQSDTWALAPVETRPWLLMLWMVAWEQTPCGSLPRDDELIAARMGMPLKAFSKVKAVLLRSWYEADDGRMYHETITERVLVMLEKRANDAGRAATRRLRKAESHESPPEVTHESRVTPPGVGPESDTKHQAPSTSSPSLRSGERDRAVALLVGEGIPESMAGDFMTLRKAKKAPMTETALKRLKSEADKAGMSLLKAIETCCGRGWAGFEAKWLLDGQDVRTVTVPGKEGPDPALRKIAEDAAKAVPMPAHLRRRPSAVAAPEVH